MKVIIDSREQKRIKQAKEYYTKKKLKVKVEEIPIGDYIFNNQVYFEYKTIPDFINSVQSNRVFNQAVELSTTPYHFIIIVGNEKQLINSIDDTRFNPNRPSFSKAQFYGAICRLNTVSTVIRCNSTEEAFGLMQKQAVKCLDSKVCMPKKKTKILNPCVYYLAGVERISNEEAFRIVKHLRINTLKELLGISKEDLLNIDNVGDKKADNILKAIYGEV